MPKRATKFVCPPCSSSAVIWRRLLPELQVGKCQACSLLLSDIARSSSAQKPEFERINEEYYFRSVGKVRKRQAREIVDAVSSQTKPESMWLDVGCSFGYLLEEALSRQFQVRGIEPDEKACGIAQGRLGRERVIQGIYSSDSSASNSLDVISMLDVLEHIRLDEIASIAEAVHTHLRPGGLWAIKVPSSDGLYYRIADTLSAIPFLNRGVRSLIRRLWQTEYEFPHVLYFNEKSIKEFLHRHGFVVATTSYLQEVPDSTVVDRLRMDDTVSAIEAYLIAPAFYLINFAENFRHKGDALFVLARKETSEHP